MNAMQEFLRERNEHLAEVYARAKELGAGPVSVKHTEVDFSGRKHQGLQQQAMRQFEVVGDVLGADDDRRGGQMIRIAEKADWREGQLAPGVMSPDEGLVPVGMETDSPVANTFQAAVPTIEFSAKLQKPYRPERMSVTVVRTGASAAAPLLRGRIFVGTDLMLGTTTPINLEVLGLPVAFGFRLSLKQMPPGVFLTCPITLSAALAGGDTIFADIFWMGRIVH